MIIVDGEFFNREKFDSKAKKLVSALRSLGLKEGDVIAVMLKNSIEYLEVIQASKQLGTSYCPINWHLTRAETSYLIQDSKAKVFIVSHDLIHLFENGERIELPVILVGGDAANANVDKYIYYQNWSERFVEDNEFSLTPRGHMAYTSGTTGKPKGVVRMPIDYAKEPKRKKEMQDILAETLGLTHGIRALLPAPLYHSAPSLFAQHALQVSSLFVLMSKFDPIKLLENIQKFKIELVYLVPIMFVRLLKLELSLRNQYDLSSIKFIASTGAPCSPEIKKQMIDWLGPVVYETYASSEAGLVTLINSEQALKKPGSAGLPVGRGVVKIYSEDGSECDHGQVGYVYVRQYAYGDFEYQNNSKARREIDRNGLINLGDIGYVDEDGYLFICDRRSDMVISGGVNIYPAEIEHQIMQYAGVADCAVIGIPDEEYGESLMAFIQPLGGEEDFNLDSLRGLLEEKLAKYKIPKIFKISKDLPRDDNGKIYKRYLREKLWEGKNRKV